jgi:hypothetical protein
VAARFFVDENDLALGRRLAQLHPDAVLYRATQHWRRCHAAALTMSGFRSSLPNGSS